MQFYFQDKWNPDWPTRIFSFLLNSSTNFPPTWNQVAWSALRRSLHIFFLALMGYWVSIWIAISLEEQFICRWRKEEGDRGFIWSLWNCREMLPIGLAALVAFLVGSAGSILCMAQVWYTGPISKLVGEYGGDVSSLTIGACKSSCWLFTDGKLCRLLLVWIGFSTIAMAWTPSVWTMSASFPMDTLLLGQYSPMGKSFCYYAVFIWTYFCLALVYTQYDFVPRQMRTLPFW